MKQKQLIIGGVLVLLLIVGGIFAFTRGGNEAPAEETSKKKRIVEPTNVIPVEERPYAYIVPRSDGRNIEIHVDQINKPADEVEYELEYQAGSLLQGAFGQIDISSLPAMAEILLGSCSAGGSCTYHEDVQGGTLVMRFVGPENYALKQDWKYIENDGSAAHSSRDAKFQIESEALADADYIIIYNSPGYPELEDGQVVSEPYALHADSSLDGEAELTIRSSEEGELTIMGWNGDEWVSFDTTSEGKAATATVELLPLYVVVK